VSLFEVDDAGCALLRVPDRTEILEFEDHDVQMGWLAGVDSAREEGIFRLLEDRAALPGLSSAAKRALDVLGATLGLLVFALLFLVVAVAIKLESPGPVLFKQPRAGRGGRFFVLYKFRSMRAGSALVVGRDGAIVKPADDERITRVGRVLRRFSLDEAPQLFNVLRGEMSLVGPRPLVEPEFEAVAGSGHVRRADVRPGLTGLWQVSGRSFVPFEDMIRLDHQYAAGWSLAMDLKILMATIPAVLSGRGAR
jgi:lipopolysaccharide/colanic/teichoic acid biosynthesis glycosyltransferase